MAGRQGWNLRGSSSQRSTLRGEAHPAWRGDAARTTTKRVRAQRMYSLGPCEICGCDATDRHHKDGNTGNNAPANIQILCRRCHMTEDGRLERFLADLAARNAREPLPPTPCRVCSRPSKPLRRGRCHTCNEYLRRNGVERPAVAERIPCPQPIGQSGHRGIVWDKPRERWLVRVRSGGKLRHVGIFREIADAVAARDAFVRANCAGARAAVSA